MAELIPLDQARQIVLSHARLLEPETVSLLEAAGRVAAADLRSDIDSSPFAASAMDGFAVRASQLESASPESPVALRVIAEVAAGDCYEGELGEGECLRIMTGAPVPACTDSVVKYEVVKVVNGDGQPGSRVSFDAPTALGKNVRKPGEEAKAGDVIVRTGELINSAGLGFLASCGVTEVPVYRRPRVAVIATGSELVDPDQVPGKGKIRNSNSSAVAACVMEAGGLPQIQPIVRDDYNVLAAAVKAAAAEYDCILTTGGAANGDFDFIEQVVEDLGEAYVTTVNLRPGKAQTFGIVDGAAVFGLPGNPAAAYMGCQMLVRPLLLKMQGRTRFDRVKMQTKLAETIKAGRDGRMTLVRATVEYSPEQGCYLARPMRKQSSGLFGPLQRSNALICIERGDVGHEAGSEVSCLLLDIPEESVLAQGGIAAGTATA